MIQESAIPIMNIERPFTRSACSRVRARLTTLLMTASTLAMLVVSCDNASAGTISTLPSGTASTPTPTTTGIVRISENRLLRDGVPWVPHAVQMVAFVAPPRYQTGAFLAAYRHYNISEFAAIKSWGADSVRMQLSQPGADPDDPKYDHDFVNKFIAGVKAARAAGLVVIVSIQDEEQSGEESPADLPNAATRHVWATLAPQLNGDDGIVYEMFNEPRPKPSAANWASWADAMNAVVATIRDTGATNTLLADGLNFAETLDGVIPLDDPLHRMAYSSHPYFHNRFDQSERAWNRKFGAVAARLPVIVGEWTSATTYFCDADTAAAAHAMLRYMAARNIGLVAVTYDFGLPRYGGIVSDYRGTPTTFAGGKACKDVGFGPGALVQKWYRTGSVPAELQ